MIGFIKNTSLKKLILLLCIIGFATYATSFTNQYVWDDDHFFHQNLFTQSLNHIKEIFTSNTTAGAGASSNYYRPLTTLSFAIDHQIWGWNPFGLHLTNTLFHVANAILLFLLLFNLRFGKIGSYIVSIIFLIHPIQTEAVTYLSSRGDIFYTFFLLLSLHLFAIAFYTKSIRIVAAKKIISIPTSLLLVISVLLFPLSILSKEGALTTVPMYAGVILVLMMQKKLSLKNFHKNYREHFIVVLLLIWITLVYFGIRLTILNFNDSLNYSGDQSAYAKNLSIRLYTFVKTILIYIRLLLVPYPLYLERTTEIVTSPLNGWFLGGMGAIAYAVFAGWFEFVKKHTVWIFFALILIFANLFSVSGIVPMTGLLRENWLYMPMIGFYMIIIVLLRMTFMPFIKAHTRLISIFFVIYCLILIGMTIQQNYNWRNKIAYFEHNLRFANTARLHLNLGNAYYAKGNVDKAVFHLKKAKGLENGYPQTYYNLGNIYLHKGEFDKAEAEYLASLLVDPNFLYSYPMLIQIYERNREYEKTLPYLKRLTKIYPNDLTLQISYAEGLWNSGNVEEAEKEFAIAIKLSKNDPKLIKAIEETKKKK